MKTLLALALVLSLSSAYDYKLESKSVGDSTECFFGLPEVMDKHNNGNISNSCFVQLGKHYLIVDSGPSYAYAKQSYKIIKNKNNLPISYLINTHEHDDHWLGNSFYNELGVKIIGSAAFRDVQIVKTTRMQKRIEKEAYKKTTQILPKIFVENEKTLLVDDFEVKLIRVHNRAHSLSDILVYIPKKKIVFAGDLVFNGRLPSIRDGNLDNWIEVLLKIDTLDVEYIVGGHGEVVTKDATKFTYEYLVKLRDKVAALVEEGVDIADAVDTITMKEYKDVPFYDVMQRQNVEIAYRMMEWNDE